MREVEIRKTQFTVTDLLSWMREGTLDLTPAFQRRSVWKPGAKSFFIDTVVRGLPAPIIYLRQRIELSTQKTIREVVDGQQRLRTIFAYVDPSALSDYDSTKDGFTVREIHNKHIARKPYSKLQDRYKQRILSYEFSTHVLPVDIEDREVLAMFARLNATGEKLNHQELRNAAWFGEMKTLTYSIAMEQLERWREWRIFSDDQIARMKEVEATSDLILNMMEGLTGKTQKRLDDLYKEFDETLPGGSEIQKRFRHTMDEIESHLGREISTSVYHSEIYFFTLFAFVYDRLYGLGSKLDRRAPRKLPAALRERMLAVGKKFSSQRVPRNVLDAVQRASSDLGRRRTRLEYMQSQCDV